MLSKRIVYRLISAVNLRRSTATNLETPAIRCAIVGSGPSGFYTAKYLFEKHPSIRIDILDTLPTPFGLVRQGVAPDHPEVKSVIETFSQVAANSRFRFFGNVTVGDEGLSIAELKEAYNIIVLAYGASSDLPLNIPGEDLKGVMGARSFVNWYNGHPMFTDIGSQIDLKSTKRVVIIGNGNVAIDCARILTKHPDELAVTDISTHALTALRESAVEEVVVLGRRGHAQASFTIKELRELTRLTDVSVKISHTDIDAGATTATVEELSNNRPKTRIVDLIKTVADASEEEESAAAAPTLSEIAAASAARGNNSNSDHHHHPHHVESSSSSFSSSSSKSPETTTDVVGVATTHHTKSKKKIIDLRFLWSPKELLPRHRPREADHHHEDSHRLQHHEDSHRPHHHEDSHRPRDASHQHPSRVGRIVIERNRLEGPADRQRAVPTGLIDTIEADLVLKSVGYKCEPIEGVPFNARTNTVPHIHGRVVELPTPASTSLPTSAHAAKTGGRTTTNAAAPANAASATANTANAGITSAAADDKVVAVVPGLYVTGWLKRGPSGIIGSNISDAKETATAIVEDLLHSSSFSSSTSSFSSSRSSSSSTGSSSSDVTTHPFSSSLTSSSTSSSTSSTTRFTSPAAASFLSEPKPDPVTVLPALGGVSVVNWGEYLKIDAEEVRRGQATHPPKPREKIVYVGDLIRAAKEESIE